MKKNRNHKIGSNGFTLIEMLVVIAIIGIVAALVVNMNAKAQQMKRKAAVDGEKAKLVTLINAYHEKLGFYPPDNPNNAVNAGNFIAYEGSTAMNPLLYELTGGTNPTTPSGNITLFTGSVPATGSNGYQGVFNLTSVNNAVQDGSPQNFFAAGLKTSEYTNYNVGGFTNLYGLVVPVANQNTSTPNFWHYDASSPNRHNSSSFDLWAEYPSGGANGLIITNGNW